MEYGQPRGQQRPKRELTSWDTLPTADKFEILKENKKREAEKQLASPPRNR